MPENCVKQCLHNRIFKKMKLLIGSFSNVELFCVNMGGAIYFFFYQIVVHKSYC